MNQSSQGARGPGAGAGSQGRETETESVRETGMESPVGDREGEQSLRVPLTALVYIYFQRLTKHHYDIKTVVFDHVK